MKMAMEQKERKAKKEEEKEEKKEAKKEEEKVLTASNPKDLIIRHL